MAGDTHTDDVRGVPELEQRLAADEARLASDEARLAADEARIEAEEIEVRENRIIAWFGVALALALVTAVTAVVISLVALHDDVGTIRNAAADDSVATTALQDGSVTTDKLADGAVTRAAVAGGAVGSGQLEPGAVTGAHVARDSLTGADIRERTLATVPAARTAATARTATDSARLGGLPSRVYLSALVDVRAASAIDARRIKGPVVARCPSGSRVISGGARVQGAASGAAIVTSAPEDGAAWTATARVARTPAPPWQLIVSAVCAEGGG
jgi:hypothetical protein